MSQNTHTANAAVKLANITIGARSRPFVAARSKYGTTNSNTSIAWNMMSIVKTVSARVELMRK